MKSRAYFTKYRAWLPLAAFCLLGGCADLALRFDFPDWLAIAPKALGARTLEQQMLLHLPNQETRALETVLEISEDHLDMALLAFGMRLATISYDGRDVYETSYAPIGFPFRRMIRDFLLVAAPMPEIIAALPSGWQAEESRQGENCLREFHENGKPLIRILYETCSPWRGRVRFSHIRLGYQLTLDTHEL
ncbi:MAG: DUF3261 domain-containing protein [Zoogloeaceae bacterium]|jgi:hypothetical protein|nr:DUF3261 domain-containing protein [Zoogloeaceae bacterium]